jgi:hypothetical protein
MRFKVTVALLQLACFLAWLQELLPTSWPDGY